MISPIVSPVVQEVPEKATFMISFSHTICLMSSNSATLKPSRFPDLRRGLQKLLRQPGKCAEPDHLHPVVMRMARRPDRGAETSDNADRNTVGAKDRRRRFSGDPRPFWMVWTIVSGPSKGRQERAAASTSNDLVAMMTRSQGPMPSVVVEA